MGACNCLCVCLPDTPRAELQVDLVPPSLLPKLRRMVTIMITAQYAPAQQGYAALREKAVQQVQWAVFVVLSCCLAAVLTRFTRQTCRQVLGMCCIAWLHRGGHRLTPKAGG